MLKQIKSVTKSDISRKAIPTVNEIFNSKSSSILEDVTNTINDSDYSRFIPIAKELSEKFDNIEIIAALIKSKFNSELLENYKSNVLEAPKSEDIRLFLSVGRRDGITPKSLVNFIKDTARIKATSIGDIDILENFSFVNITPDVKDKVIEKCIGRKLNNRKVNIEIANRKRK